MTEFSHSARNSLADIARAYALGDDALLWTDKKGGGEIPYADISKVRLNSYPSFDGDFYQCKLSALGGKGLKIRSHDNARLGVFEGKTETYTPFLRELLRRIAASPSETRFVAGSSGLWIVWLAVAVLWVLGLLLMAALLLSGVEDYFSFAFAAMLLFIVAPFIFKAVRKGGANTFDPANPPAELTGG